MTGLDGIIFLYIVSSIGVGLAMLFEVIDTKNVSFLKKFIGIVISVGMVVVGMYGFVIVF